MRNSNRFKAGIAGVILAGISATVVGAEPDLYYMHNASAYRIWSDDQTCAYDMRNAGNPCIQFARVPICGFKLFSTAATQSVAADKLNRNDPVVIRHASNGSVFCELTPG